MVVRTRFAPSPTGFLHIGGVRTALYSWLHAQKHGGAFVLRIEDTDVERSRPEYVDAIIDAMHWLGLTFEGPYFQSQRYDRYQQVIQQLLENGQAYHCYCSKERLNALREEQLANKQKPRYDGCCRNRKEPPPEGVSPVVRLKNPTSGTVVVDDMIHGRVLFQNEELDDLVIARSDGTPTFHLGVVVDDMDMGITHVIRGDDHLNNTPRQINILKALGGEVPTYAHVPMILNTEGKPLSKREGAADVMNYKHEGYLPEALLNYLVRLGWAHGDQEIFSIEEMIKWFDVGEVHKAASSINPEKLNWLNQHYIKTLPLERLAGFVRPMLEELGIDESQGPSAESLIDAQRERAKTLRELVETSVYFYRDFDQYDEKAAKKNLKAAVRPALERLKTELAALNPWDKEAIHNTVDDVAEALELKMGKVAQPLRVAVTGSSASPPIDITVFLLGRERVQERIQRALDYIDGKQD